MRFLRGSLAAALLSLSAFSFATTQKLDGSTTPIVEADGAGGHRLHVVENGLNGGNAKAISVDSNGNLTTASASGTATGTLTASGQTVSFSTTSYATAGLQITGTWVANVTFEGSVDGSTWFALNGLNPASSANGTTTIISANGQWRFNCAGLQNVRARCSAYTSGTVTVTWFGQGAPGGVQVAHLADPTNGWLAQVTQWASNDSVGLTNAGLFTASVPLLFNAGGSNLDRWREMPTADAQTATGIAAVGLMGFNGSTVDRVHTDSGGIRVSLYGKSVSAGDVPVNVLSASDGMGIGNYGLVVHSMNHLYDPASGSANFQRNNNESTALASAARTATTSSADQINYNGRGVQVILNVTAASGTGGLTLTVQGKDPVSGAYYALNANPTAVTATGTTVYEVYPGIGAAAGGVTQRTSASLPRTFRVTVTHGDATSYTYSVGMVDLL